MKVGSIIIKTILDNKDFDKGIEDVKAKGSTAGDKIQTILGRGLSKSFNLGKGLGRAFTTILKTVTKLSVEIIGLSVLLGGLMIGVGILSAGFKKAFTDPQIKANLDYIKFALSKAIEPAVNKIVEIVGKLVNLLLRVVQYIQYIIYAWTGRNIFENASIDAYADSLKQAEKNAKGLNKQLASFDEMNVLKDNSGTETNNVMPSLDLSNMENMEVPSWIDWIVRNKDIVISALAGITAGLIGMKVFGLDPIETSGVILFISGLVYAIKGLLAYLEDPSWENFGKVIEGIGLAVIGLGLLFFGLPVIIAGVIIVIIGILIKYWDDIKKWINDKIFGWLNEKINKFREKGFWGNVLADIMTGIKMIIYEIMHSLDGMFTGIKQMLDGLIKLFSGDIAGGLVLIFKGALNTIIGLINGFVSLVNGMLEPLRWILDIGGEAFGFQNVGTQFRIPMLPKLRKGTILNNPGKGVPVAGGRARAGEAGREAYLPLSDEQLLEELGSSIGRHVVVNLTNIMKMNGRTLIRETKKVQSEDNFAYNG